MKKLGNLVADSWVEGDGTGSTLYNAITGDAIYTASSQGIEISKMYHFARETGGHSLRKMTFQERGRMLKALALHLHSKKDSFYKISAATGATKMDSWIDIEGGIGNLFTNASLRRKLPNTSFAVDGDFVSLSKEGTFGGHHILVPKEGVAIHINAYNFPIWGMLEKIAVNLLAGVPAIVKPATVTSYLTEYMVREIHSSDILPIGALQLVCGSARDILDFVDERDVVTFTGSASTGRALKVHPNIIENSVPFNLEADSLNAAILGPDAGPGTPEFDLFVKEIRKEMTVKAGQKCTAVRRILVPEIHIDGFQDALIAQLSKIVIGDPSAEGVRMGPLVGCTQREDVVSQVSKLNSESEIVFGSTSNSDLSLVGASSDVDTFLSPILLRVKD